MRSCRISVVALAAVFLIGGCSGLRIKNAMVPRMGDWVMYGGSPSRANVSQATVRLPLFEVWQYNAQGGVSGTPVVRDDVVIVGTLHGEIQAAEVSSGRRLGYKVVEGAVVGTPVLDGSRVIYAMSATKESVASMDLGSGDRVWMFAAGPVESAPLLFDKSIFVTTLEGSLICIDKFKGEETWKYTPAEDDRSIRSSPATDGTVIVFGSDNGFVYGVDRATGTQLWKTSVGGSVFASPIIIADLVVVGTIKGSIVGLEKTTGALRWTYATGSRIYSAAAGTQTVVYAGSSNGMLHALDARTGALLWNFEAKSVIASAPLVTSDVIFIGSLDKKLYALDAATGRELWQFEAEGRIRVSPVLYGDYLLVTSEDKYITALRPELKP